MVTDHLFMNTLSIFYIEVEKIQPNPYQPRRSFDEAALQELAGSIQEYGILEPLLVSRQERETPDGGLLVDYQLIAGERRLMAAKLVGLTTVPAIIRDDSDERVKLEISLIENLQREDLNPVEKARAFARLADEFGLVQREIAFRVGKSREWVANTMRLLALSYEAQKAIESGRISEGHARIILSLVNPEERHRLLETILAKNLTVREAEAETRLMSSVRARETPRIVLEPDPISRELASRLEETLGTKVNLRRRGERGEIAITFHSPEELDSIIQKILGDRKV